MEVMRYPTRRTAFQRAVLKQMVVNKSVIRKVQSKKYYLKRIRGTSSFAGATLCGFSSAGLSVTSLLDTLGWVNAGGPSIRVASGIAAVLFARGTVGLIKDARARFRQAARESLRVAHQKKSKALKTGQIGKQEATKNRIPHNYS